MDMTSILLIAAAVAGVAYFLLQPAPHVAGPIDTAVGVVTGVVSAIGSGAKSVGGSIIDGGVTITSKIGKLPGVSLATSTIGIATDNPTEWLSPKGFGSKTIALGTNIATKINPMNWF